jgi:hypothetical protein
MKRQTRAEKARRSIDLPWIPLKEKEKKSLLTSLQQADEQCEKLGVLDPVETEPALLYAPLGGGK